MIRIIYDYNITKLIQQYNNIKDIFPTHTLEIYDYKKNIPLEHSEFNIYIDSISENYIILYPTKYHILLVNDHYIIKNKFLRKESYNRYPLIIQDDIINVYFCVTQYSYNYLKRIGININKLFLFNGLTKYIEKPLNKNNKHEKYIYYEIDIYSKQFNINILNIWTKYFLNRPEKLIIKYLYIGEDIIDKYANVSKQWITIGNIHTYKNIIIFDDIKYLKNYNIDLVILNVSNFNLIYKLYEYIIDNIYIIPIKNEITTNNLDETNLLFDDFSENNIYSCLTKYFNLSYEYKKKTIIKNNNILKHHNKLTITNINNFFNQLHFKHSLK